MTFGNGSRPLATSWGYHDLDRIIGPLVAGRLYVIGARPSNGKTSLLLNILNSIYDTLTTTAPRKVLCWWSELDSPAAYRCWAALRLGLNEDDALMEATERLPIGAPGRLQAQEATFEYAHQGGKRWWIRFSQRQRPTLAELMDEIDRTQPDVVFFDYLQRIKPSKGQDRFTAIAEAAVGLQVLAAQQGRTVVVASQFKRKGDDLLDKYRAPALEDFKLAGEIEEAADVCVGLFRLLRRDFSRKDEAAVRSGDRQLSDYTIPNTMAVRVLKHRYRGPAADAIIRLTVDGKRIYDQARAPEPWNRSDAYEPD